MLDWSRYPNFGESEFRCKCGCGRAEMMPEFLDRLQRLRDAWGKPLPVNSGFRCPEYNAKVSSTGTTGPHTTGRAVDIAVSRADALDLLVMARREFGFTGVGVHQKGGDRFIHLDDIPPGGIHPRPNIWSY